MSSTFTRNGMGSASSVPPPREPERPWWGHRHWLIVGAAVIVVFVLASLLLVPRLAPTEEAAPVVEPTPEPITVNGSVVPVERARLGFDQPGQITELPVSVGEMVRRGM
jgi:multidrug efflux pump subunit AcrA (membrane-fusion protein)